MARQLVISDIHGMFDELQQLLKAVRYRPTSDRLIVLGDLIDRGPRSREVLDFFMLLGKRAGSRLTILKGNHEDLCIKAFRGGDIYGSNALSLWLMNGGDATVASLGDADPGKYLAFMEQLPLYLESGDCIFVHGGVDPDLPVSETDPETLLWTRSNRAHKSGKTVIVGHTIKPEVTFYPEARTLYIDTGACKAAFGQQGRLSLVDLTGGRVHWIGTGERAAGSLVSEPLSLEVEHAY